LLKVLATGESIIRQLGVDFDMVEYTRQSGERLLKKRLSPWRQARDYSSTLLDFWELIRELPFEAKQIFYQLSEGLLKTKIEHIGLEPLRRSLERASNHLALAFIVAALLVGSSFVVAAEVPPIVGGMPVISLVGYIIAVLLGILLLISVLRKPRA
jgi:ubiquinone biosynthesis protein